MHNTGENLVKCDKCEYQTTTKSNLKRHNNWNHEEHQVCTLCPFSDCKSSVAIHFKNKHGEIIKCSLWDYQSTNEIQIRLHTENKHQNITYDCDECDTKLTSLRGLKKHKEYKLHKGVRYKCCKCYYLATLQGILKSHIQAMYEGIKYPCDDCSYSASTPRSLSLHKRTKCCQ